VIEEPITVAFGVAAYRCHYTQAIIFEDYAVKVGPIMPNLPSGEGQRLIANTDAAKAAHKQSIRWFHESEANCNTCMDLERVPHEKRKGDSFLYGKCKNPEQAKPPYPQRDGVMMFPPDDPMHMPCYQPRWTEETKL
jgi:hypothetical protein